MEIYPVQYQKFLVFGRRNSYLFLLFFENWKSYLKLQVIMTIIILG